MLTRGAPAWTGQQGKYMLSVSANRLFAAAVSAACFLSAGPATAQVFTGDTTGSPALNRPIDNGESAPTGLSGVGTAVPYDALTFTVNVTGTYSLSLESSAFDAYLGIYGGPFNPGAPLTNALIYDDDDGAVGNNSLINILLTSGTAYTAVATGFSNTSFGPYSLTISGQGVASPVVGQVPEPATWAMMLIGFGLVGASFRVRRKAPRLRTA